MSALVTTATKLQDAATAYAHACGAVTSAGWVRQGPPRGWSMADTTEHVTMTNSGIGRIVGALRPLGEGETTALRDADINVHMFDGDGMAPGPGPTGTWTNATDARARFERSMYALLQHTHAEEGQLRSGAFEHPVFGLMDGVQWLLFAAVHTESHLAEVTQLRDEAAGAP